MSSRLFLAKGCGTLILELLVESVAVTDGGDVVALEKVSIESGISQQAARCNGCAVAVYVPYHQP
jgi:hypothetical protein